MSAVSASASDVDVDLRKLFAGLARDWKRILLVAVTLSAVAFILASVATPYYRAETRILIDTRESVFTRPRGDNTENTALLDEEGVISQVEIVTSTEVLRKVASDFNLAALPEFEKAVRPSLLDRLLMAAGLKSDSGLPAEERVLEAFRDRLTVYRVERSRVIAISFSSQDPKLAADIPNAIADAYLAFSRDAKSQSDSAATEWLEPEIQTLTAKVKEAEARVAAFRSQSDMPVGQNNATLATQQLSELASELSRTRANRAAAEANAESVRSAISGGASPDAFPEVVSSDLMQRLRERQVQLRADIADQSTTLLENHPRIRAMRAQLADLNRQVTAEAENILKSLSNTAKAATLREEQLVAALNRLKAESSRVGEKEVELRALEREAAAQRDLLESYLARYREATSRRDGNYLPVDARIFSRAVVPAEPYFPKIIPIVASTFVGSLLIMALATLLGELFSGRAMQAAGGVRAEPAERAAKPPPVAAAKPSPGPSKEAKAATVQGAVSVENAAEMLIAGGASRALFVSPEGDEAAASAVLVARSVADAGLRVVLVDLTASGAASRPMLDNDELPGVTDLLAGTAQIGDVIHSDRYSDCRVIPVGTADQSKAMRTVERLPSILDILARTYDLVVVECGPAGAGSLRRLVSEGMEIMVSVLVPDAEVRAARDDLAAAFGEPTLVTPDRPPPPTSPDRPVAA